jgi:hypothetical protein
MATPTHTGQPAETERVPISLLHGSSSSISDLICVDRVSEDGMNEMMSAEGMRVVARLLPVDNPQS